MTISGGSALSKEDIERMVKDAEQHANEDKQRREEAEARNQAEALVYQTEKFIADNSDKLPADGKATVESAVAELKTALNGTDAAEIKAKSEAVAKASQELGSAMYAAQQSEGASAGDAGSQAGPDFTKNASSDEDVVDAEVVDDEKDK